MCCAHGGPLRILMSILPRPHPPPLPGPIGFYVWKSLRLEAEGWLRDADTEDTITDASSAILWAKALVLASQGSGFLGDSEAAISLAGEAIPLTQRLMLGYTLVGNRDGIRLPEPLDILLEAHLSRHMANICSVAELAIA